MPAVSVIIPMFNAEKFFNRSIDSLRAQTFTDWEAICIDDGSTDNTYAAVREYTKNDPRFHVFQKKENTGLSDTRNIAMTHTTGEYIIYLDVDDFIHPQTLEIAYKLAKRENSDIVSYHKNRWLRTSLTIKKWLGGNIEEIKNPIGYDKRYELKDIATKTSDDIFPYVTERSRRRRHWQLKHCYVWQSMYRRDLIADLPFRFYIMEDFPWWSEVLLRHPRITLTRLPFYFYIPTFGSIMDRFKAMRKIEAIGDDMEYIYQVYKTQATPREREIWEYEFMWQYLIWMYRRIKYLQSDEEIAKAKDIFRRLEKQGILAKPKQWRSRRYWRKIMKFIQR